MKKILLAFILSVFLAVPAWATITIPWQSNQYGTYQEWNFTSEPPDWSNIPADVDINPYGTPNASIVAEYDMGGTGNPGWMSSYAGRSGIAYGHKLFIDLDIPNERYEPYYKVVQLELEYMVCAGSSGGLKDWYLHAYDPDTASVTLSTNPQWHSWPTNPYVTGSPGTWQDATITWEIYPQPGEEHIYVELWNSGVLLNNIEAATICVPAPGAILLGGIGIALVGLLKRRRMI